MKTIAKLLFPALFLIAFSVPLLAHHGNAAYDYEKTVTLKGSVTEWMWANPHCFLKLDAPDEKGTVQHWTIEAGNIPGNTHEGWRKDTFKPGDQVTVDVMPARNGAPIGRFRKVTLADGTVLTGGYIPGAK